MKKKRKTQIFVGIVLLLVVFGVGGLIFKYIFITPKFSDEKLFSLKIYEPWIYESLHYTVLSDGTLIVQYYDTELGREQLSEEKMNEINKTFNATKVYNMFPGVEGNMTDGVTKYIILYDENNNEIKVGGYMISGSKIPYLFDTLYDMLEDDYTRMWDARLQECVQNGSNFNEEIVKYQELD